MTSEIKRAIYEAVEVANKHAVRHPPRMEFSKKLILGVVIFAGLFCLFSVVAWILTGDWPREIAEFFIWPIIGVASYNLKTAYENRPKIENGRGDK